MKALKRTSLLQIDSHSLPVPTGSPHHQVFGR